MIIGEYIQRGQSLDEVAGKAPISDGNVQGLRSPKISRRITADAVGKALTDTIWELATSQ